MFKKFKQYVIIKKIELIIKQKIIRYRFIYIDKNDALLFITTADEQTEYISYDVKKNEVLKTSVDMEF